MGVKGRGEKGEGSAAGVQFKLKGLTKPYFASLKLRQVDQLIVNELSMNLLTNRSRLLRVPG